MNTDFPQFQPGSLARLSSKYHVQRLSVFGSTRSGNATALSDVDVLVDYESDFVPDLFELSELEEALQEVLTPRRKVDLVRRQDLHPMLKRPIESSALVVYER